MDWTTFSNLDEPIVYMFSGISMAWLLHTLLLSNRQHTVIILIVIALVGANVYQYYKANLENKDSAHKFVKQARQTSEEYRQREGDLPVNNDLSPGQALVASDTVLQKAIQRLEYYKDVDKEAYAVAVDSVFRFYDLYGEVLIGKKDPQETLVNLVDLRRTALNTIAFLYTQLEHSKHSANIQRIILIIQSSTWKCLNILKNKYGIHDHIAPVASNMVGKEHELF